MEETVAQNPMLGHIAYALRERTNLVMRTMEKTSDFRHALGLVHELIARAHRDGYTACAPLMPRQASHLRRELENVVRAYVPSIREAVLREKLRDAYRVRGLEDELVEAIGRAERSESPEEMAKDLAWGIREAMNFLFKGPVRDDAWCAIWFVDFTNLLRDAGYCGVTKASRFNLGQYEDITTCIRMHAVSGSPGWEVEVRKYLHGMFKLKGLEPQFLEEVWSPSMEGASS